MGSQLEIQPRELKFIVELYKQIRCAVSLTNKTDQYLAFKVKTTSPKKYCVRPNVGVIPPKGVHQFVVIMQAMKTTPVDLTCKDKFLVQSTVVPKGTADEDITSEVFSKDGNNYVEDVKMRVNLVVQPTLESPELSPINGTLKQVDDQADLKAVNNENLKPLKDDDVSHIQDVNIEPIKQVEFEPIKQQVEPEPIKQQLEPEPIKQQLEPESIKQVESAPFKRVEYEPIKQAEYEPIKPVNSSVQKDELPELAKQMNLMTRSNGDTKVTESRTKMNEEEQRLFKDVEEMKSKLLELDSKLNKAEVTISNLTEERRLVIQERESLKQEMAFLRMKKVERRVQDGFPLLFVCMVALISLVAGYGFHP